METWELVLSSAEGFAFLPVHVYSDRKAHSREAQQLQGTGPAGGMSTIRFAWTSSSGLSQ